MKTLVSVRGKLVLTLVVAAVVPLIIASGVLALFSIRLHENAAREQSLNMFARFEQRLEERADTARRAARVLSERPQFAAEVSLIHRYLDPERYDPLVFRSALRQIAEQLRDHARASEVDRLILYDGHGRLVAMYCGLYAPYAAFVEYEESVPVVVVLEPERELAVTERCLPGLTTARPMSWSPSSGRDPASSFFLEEAGLITETGVPVVRGSAGGDWSVAGGLFAGVFVRPIESSYHHELSERSVSGFYRSGADAAADLEPEIVSRLNAADPDHHHAAAPLFFRSDNYYFLAFPKVIDQDEPVWVYTSVRRDTLLRNFRTHTRVVSAIFAISVLLVIPIGFYLGDRYFGQPTRELTRGAEAIRAGDYTARVNLEYEGEIGILAASFNEMATTIERYTGSLEDRVRDRTEDLELYRLMVEKTGMPAFLNDMEDGFRMTYVNEAAVQHFGYTREEILSWRAPDWNPNFTDEDLRVIREEKKIRPGMVFESVHRVKGGELVPVEVTVNPITYRGRDCSFGFFVDIRERKQNEAALREAKNRAEEAARIKSAFLANMSHEIRTPMNAVINLSRLALRTELTEQQRDYLTKILRSGEGLLGVINDVLDFSKIEAGRLELDLIPFDPKKLIRETADVTMFGARQEKEIEFVVDVPEKLPRVVGDSLRLRQVLINLVGNALKFTEHGEVVLKVRVLDSGSDHITLDFSVSDTGIGMNEEQQARLFQAFEQADNSVSRKYGGSGLGLAISNSLLEMMGSSIQVRSEPGAGSTFSFTLTLELAGSAGSCTDDTSPADLDIAGLRVLVVEDNEINRQIALELLTIAGVSGESVPGGAEALDALRSERYDLVLMDLEMPGMDGYETTRRIRQDIDPALPIIAMTAHAMSTVREQCVTAGMNDHISKPIDPDELQEVLLRWISATGTGYEDLSDAGPSSSTKTDATVLETLPGIDYRRGVRLVGDNRDFFLELLESFASDYAGVAEAVSAALATGRWEEARDIAHRVKGVAGNLGATALYEVAGDLEDALRKPADGDPGDAEVLNGAQQKFETAIGEVLGGLHQLFSG